MQIPDHTDAAGAPAPLVLSIPGLGNSGPGHWQTLWESKRADCRRVDLGLWDNPHRNTWVNKINLAAFAPVPEVILPFPAIVVGSRNDPYLSLRKARGLARTWGCRFADAGEAGHINAASGIGEWEFGQFLLDQLIRRHASAPTPATARTGSTSFTDNNACAHRAFAGQ